MVSRAGPVLGTGTLSAATSAATPSTGPAPPPTGSTSTRGPGATTDRPGLRAVLECARDGDVIVVHTPDRPERTVRDPLDLIHDLAERGVGVRHLADPTTVDSSDPGDPMTQLAVVLLALFAQMERTCTVERAAHARAVAPAKGRRTGRPSAVDPDELAAKTGITRTTPSHPDPPDRSPKHRSPATAPVSSVPAASTDHQGAADRAEHEVVSVARHDPRRGSSPGPVTSKEHDHHGSSTGAADG